MTRRRPAWNVLPWLLVAATAAPVVAAAQAVERVLTGEADAAYGVNPSGRPTPAPVLLDRLLWAGYAVDLDATILTSVVGLLVLALLAMRGAGHGLRLGDGPRRVAIAVGAAAVLLGVGATVALLLPAHLPQTALQEALMQPAPADESITTLFSVGMDTTASDVAALAVLTAFAAAATAVLGRVSTTR